MATVFRFQTWNSHDDTMRTSNRWATKEAIEEVGGKIISEGVEIDDKYLGAGEPGDRVDGMTARDFDARRPPSSDFPNYVR